MNRRTLLLAPLAFPALAAAPPGGLRFPGLRRGLEPALRAAYALLPARGKEIPVDVILHAKFEWQLAWDAGLTRGAAGVYIGVRPRPRIHLLEGSAVTTTAAFAHEMGHHTHSIFSREEREAWQEFWAANLALMPRDYARTTAIEGWSDSLASLYVPAAARVFGAVGAAVAEVIRGLCEESHESDC